MARRYRRLSLKITRAVLIAGGSVILAVAILSATVLLPAFKKEALRAENANVRLIVQQADSKIELIKSYADHIVESYALRDLMQRYNADPQSDDVRAAIQAELDTKKKEMKSVQRIVLQKTGGELLTTSREMAEPERRLFDMEEYRYFSGLDYATSFFYVFEMPYAPDYAWGNEPEEMYVATYCMNFYVGQQRYTITLFVEINDIVEITNSLTGQMDAYVWIDSLRAPFLSRNEDEIRQRKDEALSDRLWFSYDVIQQADGYLFMHTLADSRWIFAAYSSGFTLLKNFGGTLLLSVGIFLLLILAVVALMIPLINRFTDPIKTLHRQMQLAAAGNLSIRSDIRTNDEIEELSRSFNSMLQELNGYIGRLLEKEKTEQRMKYSLLISEIDPHFIYNTMNTVNYLARKERYEDIIRINSALIGILQDRLRIGSIEVFDTLSQEVDVVRQYMLIQQYRFHNDVQLALDIPDDALQSQVPKNVLQPLVENALLHGFIDDDGDPIRGRIDIRAHTTERGLVLEVTDNGKGMPESKMDELNGNHVTEKDRGRHIGIQNIKDRLAYLYGTGDCLRICPGPDGGVSVTLTLGAAPLLQTGIF